jgi:hypothetical protein
VVRPQGIGARHLSHDAHIGLCLFTVFPTISVCLPAFILTLAQTYNDVPMRMLRDQFNREIHTPSVNSFEAHGQLGYRHFTFAKHPLFADVFVPVSTPNPVTADCSRFSFDLEPVPASLNQEMWRRSQLGIRLVIAVFGSISPA